MPSWSDVNVWIYGAASALFAGLLLLIRKIMTSESKVALLEQKLTGIEEDLTEMKNDLKSLIRRNFNVDN